MRALPYKQRKMQSLRVGQPLLKIPGVTSPTVATERGLKVSSTIRVDSATSHEGPAKPGSWGRQMDWEATAAGGLGTMNSKANSQSPWKPVAYFH